MIFAAIFAGGTGSRMGCKDMPKQYILLGDKPVLIHTLERFLEVPDFERIYVLCPHDLVKYTCELIEKYTGLGERITVTPGGATRNDTLKNMLDKIESDYGNDDESIVLTHDAVRPFITRRIIDDNIKYTLMYGACDTAIGASDTIVQSDKNGFIAKIPERALMYQGQTPQSFNVKKLREAVNSLTKSETDSLTDACGIFAVKGLPVYIVRGEVSNIKLTYPDDVAHAETILKHRKDT